MLCCDVLRLGGRAGGTRWLDAPLPELRAGVLVLGAVGVSRCSGHLHALPGHAALQAGCIYRGCQCGVQCMQWRPGRPSFLTGARGLMVVALVQRVGGLFNGPHTYTHAPHPRSHMHGPPPTPPHPHPPHTHRALTSVPRAGMQGNTELPREAQAVSPMPDTATAPPLKPGHTDLIVCACDGVWDVLSRQDAIDFVTAERARGLSLHEVAGALVHRAMARRSMDNITVVLVLVKAT